MKLETKTTIYIMKELLKIPANKKEKTVNLKYLFKFYIKILDKIPGEDAKKEIERLKNK